MITNNLKTTIKKSNEYTFIFSNNDYFTIEIDSFIDYVSELLLKNKGDGSIGLIIELWFEYEENFIDLQNINIPSTQRTTIENVIDLYFLKYLKDFYKIFTKI